MNSALFDSMVLERCGFADVISMMHTWEEYYKNLALALDRLWFRVEQCAGPLENG